MLLLTYILFVHLIALSVCHDRHILEVITRMHSCISSGAERNDLLANNGNLCASLAVIQSSHWTPFRGSLRQSRNYRSKTEEQRAEVLETVSRRRPTTPDANTYRCVTVCPTTKTRPFTITRKTPAEHRRKLATMAARLLFPLPSNPPTVLYTLPSYLLTICLLPVFLDLISVNTTLGKNFRTMLKLGS